MSFIPPNSTIRLLHNVPLDKTYDHTIYFGNEADQAAYFMSMTKFTFTHQSYQRVQRGFMRVEKTAEDLYDCNYLMFQNTAFGSKWFYAFVKAVEYINNAVSQVEFELDVMQTWHFNYTLDQCFVEREHIANDAVGNNITPENLDIGDYVSDPPRSSGHLSNKRIVVAATFDKDYNDVGGGVYGGLFSGLAFNVFTNPTDAQEFIEDAGTKSEGIVSVFYAPTDFITGESGTTVAYNISEPKTFTTIGNYTPRNNKLFTYPYNFLYVSNLNGNSAVYRYEFFASDEANFLMNGIFTPNPCVTISPRNYKFAVTEGQNANFDEMLSLSGWPQCAYNTDTFKAWLAQTASTLPLDLLGGGIKSGATSRGAPTLPNPSGVGTGTAGTGTGAGGSAAAIAAGVAIASILAEGISYAVRPNQAKGGASASVLAAINMLDFYFMRKHITVEMARIIDDYFDMYGYATHRVKIPNRAVRPHWCYCKTIGCLITGSIPADDAAAICRIYDNGITWWKNPEEVGNYSLDNRV